MPLFLGCNGAKPPVNQESSSDSSSDSVADSVVVKPSGPAALDESPQGGKASGPDVESLPESDKAELAIQPPTSKGWPNWMGPDHTGISRETGWSEQWPETGLREAWALQIGIGFSSVSIVDGRLFTMGHIDGTEYVYALKAETGDEIWSHSYPSPLVDNLHEGGPGATPTVDGDFVYTLGKAGQLYCFHAADGKIEWSKELQDDMDVPMPEWGFNGSPYILGDQLILEAGRVVSYSKLSGDKNWETERHSAGYGSAISFDWKGDTLIATLDCDGLRVVQAADGNQLDFYEWESPFRTNSTTPIVQDGLIYISSGYNVGCGLFRLDDNRRLVRIYSNSEMRNHFNNSILFDGHLYGFDGNSNLGRVVQLTCMNFTTGEVAWKSRGLGCGSLMIVSGKLLLLSDDGQLVLARATPDKYEEISRSDFLEGRCWTVPVLLDGRVYGRNAAGRLACVELP